MSRREKSRHGEQRIDNTTHHDDKEQTYGSSDGAWTGGEHSQGGSG